MCGGGHSSHRYCAGNTALVTPMMENICENIGATKADQATTYKNVGDNLNRKENIDSLELGVRQR
jgi:hypothetical protein